MASFDLSRSTDGFINELCVTAEAEEVALMDELVGNRSSDRHQTSA
jgi:hypothetical protein